MTKAIESLVATLNRYRAQYASHQCEIDSAAITMRRSEACMADISRHMTDLEKAIVALGGTVPAEQKVALNTVNAIGGQMTGALMREDDKRIEHPFPPAHGLKPGCL